MSELSSINLADHNDRVAALIVWLLDRNAPMMALGFSVSENTKRLVRELRSEIHRNEQWSESSRPCKCARCRRRDKSRKRRTAAP